jgi:hypothetical protein
MSCSDVSHADALSAEQESLPILEELGGGQLDGLSGEFISQNAQVSPTAQSVHVRSWPATVMW